VSEFPFVRIPYKEAMLTYGSDKPDLRNPLIIQDITDIFSNLDFNAFKNKIVRVIATHDVKDQPRSFFDGMTDFAISECGAKGLAWLRVMDDLTLQGPIAKFIPENEKNELLKRTNSKAGDALFFIAETTGVVEKLAGQIRIELGKRLNLINENEFKFCWIVDFPMFEIDEDGWILDHPNWDREAKKIVFSHNPFSMPQGGLEALKTKDPLDILAYQYDLVCNGIELSSGAVRNHDPEIMKAAFNLVGYSEEHIKNKFSALYNAFHYGAPPHAGIAPGFDRILMLLTDSENIREVIAFPMNSKAQDPLTGAPAAVNPKQLKDVHIKIDVKEPKND
jgi:aspartyl-tRNA synthetase